MLLNCAPLTLAPIALHLPIDFVGVSSRHLMKTQKNYLVANLCSNTELTMYAAFPFFAILIVILITVPLIATVVAYRHARNKRRAIRAADDISQEARAMSAPFPGPPVAATAQGDFRSVPLNV